MLTKILVGLLAAFVGLFSACGIFLLQGGVATVYVEDPEFWIYLPIPVNAVEIALLAVPDEDLKDVRSELEQFREILPVVLSALAECPDTVFVEVRSRTEEVLVKKAGDSLIIQVHAEDDTNVRVKIPLRGTERIVRRVTDI